MARTSATLQIGDVAPAFSLRAANRFNPLGTPDEFSLAELLEIGPTIIEFLRGTW